jgi:hypothetical protein
MSLVISNDGDKLIAEFITNKATPENLYLGLFSNNVTPDKSYTLSSLTECTGSGYAAITPLAAASWTVTEGTGAGTTPTTCAYPQQTFTLTGALTAYGYFLKGVTSGKLYGAELFSSGPYVTPAGGGTIEVTLNISSVN